MWQDFLAAIALLFIIEGIMPFLNPDSFRRTMQIIATMDNATLRTVGLGGMLIGVFLLYAVRA